MLKLSVRRKLKQKKHTMGVYGGPAAYRERKKNPTVAQHRSEAAWSKRRFRANFPHLGHGLPAYRG